MRRCVLRRVSAAGTGAGAGSISPVDSVATIDDDGDEGEVEIGRFVVESAASDGGAVASPSEFPSINDGSGGDGEVAAAAVTFEAAHSVVLLLLMLS